MRRVGNLAGVCLPCLLACLPGALAAAQDGQSDEQVLAQAYGDEAFVSIATGSRQSIRRAPAIASVITALDIAATGATDIDQVLEMVPGLHVSPLTNYGGLPQYLIRGINGRFNPQVLMLINGIPITSVFLGNRGDVWGGMPVANIARIEVLRGPGSALYGADAFAGVINVITRRADEIDGTQFGLTAGSFRTKDAWVMHGGHWGPLEVAAFLRWGSNDTTTPAVDADAQSGLDALFGTHASLAPAPARMGGRGLDAQLDLSHGRWRWRSSYVRRNDLQVSALAYALGPPGSDQGDSQRITSDLSYEARDVAPGWDLNLLAGYHEYAKQSYLMLYPPGAFGGAFPQGMIGAPDHWERNTRIGAFTVYSGWPGHRVRVGLGHERPSIYRTQERKNFNLAFVPAVGYVPVPLGSLIDVSGTAPYLEPHSRTLSYLYVQDEWELARDWTLTAGVRHDRFSDFGNTTNPRLAVVWAAAYNLSAKLLYGSAFRAPSFAELYIVNNPVQLGNPALRPETTRTVEAALAWQPGAHAQASLSLFRYRMNDILRPVPNADPTTGATQQNTGAQTGRGFEAEFAWEASNNLRLSGSYAMQRSTDVASGQDAGLAPHHHLFVRAESRWPGDWTSDLRLNRIGGRSREPGDARPPIADDTSVDLSLRSPRFAAHWDATFTVRNLFNADLREPSPAPGLIPQDLPLPRRTLALQLVGRF